MKDNNKEGPKFIVKTGPSSIKDVDKKKGIIIHYPSTFDVVDSGNERVRKGFFARTINSWGPLEQGGKGRIKALFDHKSYHMVGRPVVLKEDGVGLYAETLMSKTPFAQDILTLVEEKIITEESIGYELLRSEKAKDGALDLLEGRLYEYSFLAWGMNEHTPIIGIKGYDGDDNLMAQIAKLEKALSTGTFETDDVPHMLEIMLKQWKQSAVKPEDILSDMEGNERIVVTDHDIDIKDFLSSLDDIQSRRELWRKYDDIQNAHLETIQNELFFDIDNEPQKKMSNLRLSMNQYKKEFLGWAERYLGLESSGEEKLDDIKLDFKVLFGTEKEEYDEQAVKDAIMALQRLVGISDSEESTQKSNDPVGEQNDSAVDEPHSEALLKELTDRIEGIGKESEEEALMKEFEDFAKRLGLE